MKNKSFRVICCHDENLNVIQIDVMEVNKDGVKLVDQYDGEEARLMYELLRKQGLVKSENDDE